MASKRPTRLRGLEVFEVSGVDKTANQHAKALFFKRHIPSAVETEYRAAFDKAAAAYFAVVSKGAGADAFDAAMAGQEAQDAIQAAWNAFYETMDALRQAVCSIVENADVAPADKAAAIREAMQRAVDQIPDAIAEEATEKRQRDATASAGVAKGAASPAALSTSKTAAGDGQTEDKSVADTTLEAQLADLKARLEASETAKTAAEAKVTETENLAKADTDRIAKMEAAVQKAAERAEAAETIAKAEREAREFVELTKRASDEFPLLGKAVDTAKTLRRILKIEDEAERNRELAMLKAANAAFVSMTTEVGKAGRPTSGSALSELDERAQALTKAEPKLSLQEARDRIMDGDVALQKRYLEERANGH